MVVSTLRAARKAQRLKKKERRRAAKAAASASSPTDDTNIVHDVTPSVADRAEENVGKLLLAKSAQSDTCTWAFIFSCSTGELFAD